MGGLLPSSPHRLSRDLRCPPPSSLLLSPYGRLGGKPSQWQEGDKARWSLEVSRCSGAHLLTTAHTWANQSQIIWKQLAPPSQLPARAIHQTLSWLRLPPTHLSLLKRTTTPPCPSATAPPCCLSVAQAPSSSARPHLWLLTARSGWQQRPDGRTCSEKGQAGGQVR